jgi:hypothetical protein
MTRPVPEERGDLGQGLQRQDASGPGYRPGRRARRLGGCAVAAPELQVPTDHEADYGDGERDDAGGVSPQVRDGGPVRVRVGVAEAADEGRPGPDQHRGVTEAEGR